MATRQSSYALGHSEHELERLSRQAEVFAPFTRQLFEQAGISSGMRILDVGCGAGDEAFLAAELVGPNGEVVGADHSATRSRMGGSPCSGATDQQCEISRRRSSSPGV